MQALLLFLDRSRFASVFPPLDNDRHPTPRAENRDLSTHDSALLAAFAGEAAHVLSQKVGREARTLHSAIYWPDECAGGRGGRACTHGEVESHVTFVLNHRDGALAWRTICPILDECTHRFGATLGDYPVHRALAQSCVPWRKYG